MTEGLGPLQAHFSWAAGFCDDETLLGLRCYSDPAIDWMDPQLTQCELIVGLHDPVAVSFVLISPSSVQVGQPFSIILPYGAGDAHLRILDTSGCMVMQLEIHGQETLSLRRAGVYLVQAVDGDLHHPVQKLLVY